MPRPENIQNRVCQNFEISVLRISSSHRKWKYRGRQGVPECTRKRGERLRMLVNSWIAEVDTTGVRKQKSCASRQREEGRQTVSNIKRTDSMELLVKDSRKGDIARRKSFDSTLCRGAVRVQPL